MRITLRQSAGDERFARTAFDGQVGKRLPFRLGGDAVFQCTVVTVEVEDGGRTAVMTLDIDEQAGALLVPSRPA